jgi:hypothetical protein
MLNGRAGPSLLEQWESVGIGGVLPDHWHVKNHTPSLFQHLPKKASDLRIVVNNENRVKNNLDVFRMLSPLREQ